MIGDVLCMALRRSSFVWICCASFLRAPPLHPQCAICLERVGLYSRLNYISSDNYTHTYHIWLEFYLKSYLDFYSCVILRFF